MPWQTTLRGRMSSGSPILARGSAGTRRRHGQVIHASWIGPDLTKPKRLRQICGRSDRSIFDVIRVSTERELPMKVKELVAKLVQLDQELDVLCYSEDEGIVPEGHGFTIFEIVAVTATDAELLRVGDGVPSLKLGKGPSSQRIAVIEVTSDF